ncbi:MAG: prolyl oligopeptidase family serine peptidase [Bacteroidota bacterium]
MKSTPLFCLLLLLCGIATAQNPNKKTMNLDTYDLWNTLKGSQISNDGRWVVYEQVPGKGDGTLFIHDTQSKRDTRIPRGEKARISADNAYVIFSIKPFTDSLQQMRRRKVKEDKLPKDSLGIFRLRDAKMQKIANVNSFKVPEEWSGWIAYLLEPLKMEKDTTKVEADSTLSQKPKKKKRNKNKHLVMHRLETGVTDTVHNVKSYRFAKKGARLILSRDEKAKKGPQGAYLYDCDQAKLFPLSTVKGKYRQLMLDEQGKQAAFIADLDTTKARIRPWQLYHWRMGQDSAQGVSTAQVNQGWLVSEHQQLEFSEDGSKLYFGMAPPPILKDTSLLKEEIVNVEVWSYQDERLHTQQKVQLDRDKKRSYRTVLHTLTGNLAALNTPELSSIRIDPTGQYPLALVYGDWDYLQTTSWDGFPSRKDIYTVNLNTGQRKEVGRGVRGTPRLSPAAKYAYWFNAVDTTWEVHNIANGKTIAVTDNRTVPFYNELNDRPMLPSSYGVMGWTADDAHMLVYDRYDIWKIDPSGQRPPQRLTKGREQRRSYRYIRLDPDQRFFDPQEEIMLRQFDEQSKRSGYARLSLANNQVKVLVEGDYNYTRRVNKAKDAQAYIFSRSDFDTYPNLIYTKGSFTETTPLSDVNPQQSEYSWGSIELYQWTSLDGERLTGMLVKPENFDPNKKYPMIVNFYERSSDRLHSHRAPYPGRSTINYSYYANQGYLIFNPDVPYRIGYPGESAYNAVVSGVTALINEGFVNEERVGLQGHSWGGYQVAYLITRSRLFRCAESGAPVVNMFSAYGGIRWGSGLSRMFQYEKTQSRIGGTIWEYPLRYLENSPLFFADKIETPVLILHNDKDGAVPWYQGIEFFVALRRLGKPAWLLNYNDEPHWPVKRQNRMDFNQRMQQFFDHYLKDETAPEWMKRGVPAIEKGIKQGLELTDEER